MFLEEFAGVICLLGILAVSSVSFRTTISVLLAPEILLTDPPYSGYYYVS
jgi:hypothetical protein